MQSRLAFANLCLVFMVWMATPALAQDIAIDLGSGALSDRAIQLFILVTVLSIAPGLAIMITCFPFIVTVFAILRQALGLQQSPPNMLLVSLALFLTYFIMEPVFTDAWHSGIAPMLAGDTETQESLLRAIMPFRTFMLGRIDPDTFVRLADMRPITEGAPLRDDAPLSLLIPSFLLSELSRAFQVGFVIFLPFLIIDLVVAAVLMSMGMMMVPPAIVALPFKIAFFVVADGWALLSESLVRGYF